MGDENIKVILVELNHIKGDIAEIKDDMKHRCNTCVHVPSMKEQLKFHWTNIVAIWSTIGVVGAYFYNHLIGGK